MTAIPTPARRAAASAAALTAATAAGDRAAADHHAAEAAVWVTVCMESGVTLDQLAAARGHLTA